jgi:hypothetical protein
MSFFYDLNKKLDSIRATPEVTHQQLNERDMSRAAKGYEKYGREGMEALAKAGREGKALDPVRKKYDKYDNKEVAEDFGPGRAGPKGNQAGPAYSFSPDAENYKTPNTDQQIATSQSLDKMAGQGYSAKNFPGAGAGAWANDGRGQTKYVNRTAPGVINKIKDKLGMDMPDPAYGPKPDERERLAKRYPKPTQESGAPAVQAKSSKPATAPAKPSKPAPKGEFMGTIKGGVWTADPPKPGERGVPAPSGDPEGVPESGKKLNFADKIANAKKEVDEMLGDVAAEAMRSALSPKQQKMAALGGDPKRIDGPDLAALRKGADIDEDQTTHFVVHYKDNQKGRAAKTKVKGSSAKQAKAAWNDWNSSNTPGRFTFVAVKPVATEMDEERSKGTAFDMSTRTVDTPKAGSTERGAKHDIKHSTSDPRYTGRTVTRRTDAQGISVGADDDSDTQAGPRGRGRPKGTKGSIGAKGPSGKSKLMTKEGEVDIRDQGEYDQEGDMAKDDIKTIVRHAQALSRVLGDDDNLPEWVQSKLAKIEGMMVSIDEYMQNQEEDEEPIAEKAVSKKQQRFMGMVHSAQKGEKPASRAVGKVASTMKPKDTADFAKTKHKGLPEKKKKEVDETSEDGRLTTTRTGPGKTLTTSTTGRVNATIGNGKMSVKPGKQDKPMDADTDTASNKDTSSKSNSMVGKGIYDSMNRELELMIAESMSINMSDSTEGNKSLTITATDEDAMKLAMILKSAGLGGGDAHGGDMHSHSEEPCDTCGMQDCGCGDVQEAVDDNAPDYPTNTEQADNNFGYAGGLNKPKTDVAGDGQSTVPVTAVHTQEEDALRRMMEMAGIRTEDNIDLGPTSPEVARMSRDEVNAALRSGMNSKVDLGPSSPDIASMSNDEVNAALTLGLSPDISGMDPDSVNAEFGKDDRQYEDSMQRMREMAGIREAKKEVDEEKTDEGNKFAFNVLKAKAAGKKEADLDGDGDMEKVRESIFALNNQWKAYKG